MKKPNYYNYYKILLVFMLIMGIITIGLWKFKGRNIILVFNTNNGDVEFEINKESIDCGEIEGFNFKGANIELEHAEIYGNFRTLSLAKITYSNLASYIENSQEYTIIWKDNGILLQDSNDPYVRINNSFVALLDEQCNSYIQERFLMVLVLFIIVIVIYILISILEENCTCSIGIHGPRYEVLRFCRDIRKYWQYIVYAAKADLKAEVANSYLNRLWWLLEPLFSMLVYVIVFGGMMGRSIDNYATFVFSALLMSNYFTKTINYSVKLVRSNKDIVTKVYVPKFILLLTNMILNLFKLLFSLIILLPMMIIFKVHIGLCVFWVIPAYLIMLLLSFGLGMVFLHYGVYIDDLSYAINILLTMVMFLSGVFYDVMSTLEYPLNIAIMCFNPVAIFIDTMRNALLYNKITNIVLILIWTILSLLISYIGVHIVYKNENSYVKVV